MLFRVLLAILLFSAHMATAGSPKETISDWRIIESPDKPTTSTCIGKMSSPVCVADTMVACGAWRHPHGKIIERKLNSFWIEDYPAMCNQLRMHPGNFEYSVPTLNISAKNADFVKVRYRVIITPIKDDLFFSITRNNRYDYYQEYKYDDDYVPADDSEPEENFWDIKMGDTMISVEAIVCQPPKEDLLPVNDEEKGPFLYKKGTTLSSCINTVGYNPAIIRETAPGQWRTIYAR